MTSKWNVDFFLHVLCAYLCALGLEFFTMDMLGLSSEYSWIITAVACAVSMILLFLMTYRFLVMLIALAYFSLIMLYLSIFTDILIRTYEYTLRFFDWMVPFVSGRGSHSGNFELTLFIAAVCILSLLCFIFACLMDSSLLILLLSVVPIIVMSILTKRDLPYMLLLPTVFGIIFLFSLTAKMKIHNESSEVYSQHGYLQTIVTAFPVVIIGLLISFSISYSHPAESLRSPGVTDSTNDILSALHLPLPSSSNRTIFNLGGLGYYPLHERLGGPVIVLNARIMKVTSPTDLLLRAATYDSYQKIFWSSSNSLFSSRFHSGVLSDQTKDFFDMNRPDAGSIPADLYSSVMTEQKITIKNLSSQIGSTLFSVDHLLDIENTKYEVYYNQSSEIFQNQPVDNGETYSLTISHFKIASPDYIKNLLALEAYILAHPEAGDSDSRLKSIQDGYLPVDIPDSVRAYALSLTTDDQTPLQKVFAIREDLLTNFTYSLDVAVPPEDADFIEFFLSTKTGYCTYFASAMTVMAKANGIPARYVEGFVVDVPDSASADSPKTVTVTGKNGHAWCEVYISGIGWIPIDATASSLPGGGALSEGSSQGTALPEDNIPYNLPDEGYIPPHDQNITPAVQGTSESALSVAARILGACLLPLTAVILILAAVMTVISLRRWDRKFTLPPLQQLIEDTPREEIASYLWQRSQNHLSLPGIVIDPAETVTDFVHRIKSIPVYSPGCRKDTYVFEISHIAGIYYRYAYGRRLPSDDELNAAWSECRQLISDVKNIHKSKYAYLLHLIFHGKKQIKGKAK